MGRHSRSPRPNHRADDRNKGYSRRNHGDQQSGGGRDGDERAYDSRRRRDNDSRREESRYGYGEGDRERERDRDRERYDRHGERDRDRAGPSTRRSASPRSSRRRSRSRSRSRSKSPPKAKPNFGNSGLLAAETNTVQSVDGKNSTVLKYNEPPEARKPPQGWRLYVFKDADQTELLHVHRQSAYLFGRDRLVADIPIEHPSCSKQHAVIQYRLIKEKDEFGEVKGIVKPFIIDLESTNGTHVNDEKIPASRYYELRPSDVLKFGLSSREYVFLHDEAS